MKIIGGLVATALILYGVGPAIAASGQDLVDWCMGYPDSPRPNLCVAYVRSGMQLVNEGDLGSDRPACFPEDVPVADVIAVSLDWLEAHPELLAERMGESVIEGWQLAYPCR